MKPLGQSRMMRTQVPLGLVPSRIRMMMKTPLEPELSKILMMKILLEQVQELGPCKTRLVMLMIQACQDTRG